MFILVVAPYLLLHIPVTWGSLYQAICLLLYTLHTLFPRPHQRAGLILRTFISRDIHLLMRPFLVYVRPIVEYNSIIWSPSTARDIDDVESVQRRFTQRLPTLKNLSYGERLKCLNIFSLELRRPRTDLFGVIKLFLVWFMLTLMTCLFLAPASTLVVINLNSTSAKPIAVCVPISLVSEYN